jgi:succinyl-CoA:acetate CoA-transferase
MSEFRKRILAPSLLDKVVEPEQAAREIKTGMSIGTAGGFRFGYPKTIFTALSRRRGELKIDLWAGGPVGEEIDGLLSREGILNKRLGQQSNSTLRGLINARKTCFADIGSGAFPQRVTAGFYGPLDMAIIEAVGITRSGQIIPSACLFDGPTLVRMAQRVIVEINPYYPLEFEGMHDVYLLEPPPNRKIVPIRHPGDRIGTPYISLDHQKLACIVESRLPDPVISSIDPSATRKKIAGNLVSFLVAEVGAGRLPPNLLPLQMGLGNIADAFAHELAISTFGDLTVFSGGVGDGILELIDSGKVGAVSTSGLYFTTQGQKRFFEDFKRYRDVIVIRPLDIADCPEVIERLGVIAVNSAVEVDIYGHVNSTHIQGSQIIAGVGGSREFAQNGYVSIFVTPSTTRHASISAVVPFVSHVDHSEHNVDVIVTEQGVADLRGLEPVERAARIVQNCAHPNYQPLLEEYLKKAIETRKGHEPHILQEAFSFHTRYAETGTMLK